MRRERSNKTTATTTTTSGLRGTGLEKMAIATQPDFKDGTLNDKVTCEITPTCTVGGKATVQFSNDAITSLDHRYLILLYHFTIHVTTALSFYVTVLDMTKSP
jgi:hypothetical protein